MYKAVLFVFFFMSVTIFSFGQQKEDTTFVTHKMVFAADTNKKVVNTTPVDTTPFMTPKKKGLLSAIIPGLGQFENKQYWKIPVIYAGVGAAVYFLYDNKNNYDQIRSEQAARQSGKKSDSKYASQTTYSDEALSSLANYYQTNLNLTYVLTGVGYALQVIDAVVFAHLKGFDISEDITLRWKPIVTPQGGPGFGLAMRF